MAGGVVPERERADSSIIRSVSVVQKGIETYGRVLMTSCIADERVITLNGVCEVEAGILTNGSRLRRMRKAGEREQRERRVNNLG